MTGVDFSENAIEEARKLAVESGIDASFLVADVLDLPDELSGAFDVAFTSYGALTWLSDLGRWAAGVRETLVAGGVLHIVEHHPLAGMLDDDGRTLAYGGQGDRIEYEERGSYADRDADVSGVSTTWNHGLGDLIGAVISAGLRLERFDELDYTPWNCFPFTYESEPGRARIRGLDGRVPLLYRLTARRV